MHLCLCSGAYYSYYALAQMPRTSLRTGIQRIIMMWHFGVDDITPRPSKPHALKHACAWANSLEGPTTEL